MKYRILLVACIISTASHTLFAQTTYYKYVDPFIGSENAGNVFIGPSCPFGMVKPGPDCNLYSNSGHESNLSIPLFGFSQTHVSGTGGGTKYGNVSVMPFMGSTDSIKQNSLRANEKAALGYYSTLLAKSNINTEITASHKVAFYKFIFNQKGTKSIKLDAGSFLGDGYTQKDEAQFFVGSEIKILSDKEVCGYNRVRGGWNAGGAYTVYFYAKFDKPISQFKTWKGEKLYPNQKTQIDEGEKTGALLSFGDTTNTIQMKIGISFISTEKARLNLETETPNWKFDEVLAQTQQKWEKLLSRIEIDKNTSEKQKTMFYTGLYHTMLMPSDRTGENPLWKSNSPYYEDFYAIWDTFRTSHPLITLIDSKRQTDIVNAMLDIYVHDGYMPDARSGNFNGRTQSGSNCDVLIADAFVKGLKGIDYELALNAMLKNALVPPGRNEEKEGRGGLSDYNTLGYVSLNYPRSGSRTVEYAYNDFCIALVAKGLGNETVFNRFSKQAENWKNLWRDYSNNGSTGFIMPREANGKWVDTLVCTVGKKDSMPYHPLVVEYGQCVPWWQSYLYEASSWEYSFFVPQDVAGLIQKSGGNEAFKKRLDTFFVNKYYNVSNEPSFLTPVLYHWIGLPNESGERLKKVVNENFNETRKGLPGNDDSGAMSSWLAFHTIGLYPNAGQSFYLIHSPLVAQSTIHLDNGKDFKIIAKNFSDKNQYIVSAKFNNQVLDQAWIEHSEILKGGILELEMSDKSSDWGSRNLPPSLRFN